MLDRHVLKLVAAGDVRWPLTLFVSPDGTPAPALDDREALVAPDSPWRLIHPAVPDYPPETAD